jgi:AcrR family transcriptional regulator
LKEYELLLTLCTRILMTTKKSARKAIQPRKTPMQRRSAETVAVILEAAARILEAHGFEGFNTNAVAERAGVSIGSLYQYFPNKDALLSGLIERECLPLLANAELIARNKSCRSGLRDYIRASISHQMRRPKLARLIDIVEQREVFERQVLGTRQRLLSIVQGILSLPGAPLLEDMDVASADLLAIIRALVDAAGERGEDESQELLKRVEGAVWGYLRGQRVR